MNRPLWRLAWLYAGGLLVADRLGAGTEFWLLAALVLVGAAVVFRAWRVALLATATVAIAGLNLAVHVAAVSPHALDAVAGAHPQIVTLHGTLAGAPSERIVQTDTEERRRTLATLRVTALERDGVRQPARGFVAATMPGTLGPEFFAGQTVAVTGVLRAPRPPLAPGLFDFRAHLARKEIHHTLETLDATDWLALDTGRRPPLADRFNRWARTTSTTSRPSACWPMSSSSRSPASRSRRTSPPSSPPAGCRPRRNFSTTARGCSCS
jgi:hypothetical protein